MKSDICEADSRRERLQPIAGHHRWEFSSQWCGPANACALKNYQPCQTVSPPGIGFNMMRPASRPAMRTRRGEDIADGELLLTPGIRIDARHIGLLAAQGFSEVAVRRRPIAAVISTGNELRQPGDTPPEGAIYDSNRAMLMALASSAGFEVTDGGCLPDNGSLLGLRLLELSVKADLIVSSAGALVGDEDNSFKAAAMVGSDAASRWCARAS